MPEVNGCLSKSHDDVELSAIRRAVDPVEGRLLRRLLVGQRVVLASQSPRRRAILAVCGVPCRVRSSDIDEPIPHGPDWRRWVRTWALRKAQRVAETLSTGLIIAADTIVVDARRGLGKPRDRREAENILRKLSGRWHHVYTGVAVVNAVTGRSASGSAVTAVRFRMLTVREIRSYVKTGEPMDKAGAYGIQGRAKRFVERVDGPMDNVIGLPVRCVAHVTKRVLL